MDSRTKLCVLHDDAGVFTDHSAPAADYKRDDFTVTITTGDYLYIGFEKTINALYAHLTTPNANTSNMTAEYYNESGWQALTICDQTQGLSRSGFVTWERPTDACASDVDGQSKVWIRLAMDADTSAVVVRGLNLLFSDDNTICAYEPILDDDCYYPPGQTSHILKHVAARNYIMSILRIKAEGQSEFSIDYWDVLDIYELQEAANYYAIAQIYFTLSDNPDDHYWAKYMDYMAKFEKLFELGSPKVDLDGDGVEDDNEKVSVKTSRWSR